MLNDTLKEFSSTILLKENKQHSNEHSRKKLNLSEKNSASELFVP